MACIHNLILTKCCIKLQQNGPKTKHIEKLLRKNYELQ